MSAKETLGLDAASLIEELSDEALTACVGGTGLLTNTPPVNSSTSGGLITGTIKITAEPTNSTKIVTRIATSDRNKKEKFLPVDVQEILTEVVKLPIETWNYKQQDAQIRHIGPMAQDFAAAFGVGEDNLHINMVDANGVNLAAIQALYKMLQEKDAQIGALRADLDDLKQQLVESKATTSVAMPVVAFSRRLRGATRGIVKLKCHA